MGSQHWLRRLAKSPRAACAVRAIRSAPTSNGVFRSLSITNWSVLRRAPRRNDLAKGPGRGPRRGRRGRKNARLWGGRAVVDEAEGGSEVPELPEPRTRADARLAQRPAQAGSPRERQRELRERRAGWSRRRPGPEPEPSEQVTSRLSGSRRLEPAHRSTAARTNIQICLEHMSEQPGPSFSRSRLVSVSVEVELELIARSRRRRGSTRISGRVRNNFSAEP